jgi:hypothetical protein
MYELIERRSEIEDDVSNEERVRMTACERREQDRERKGIDAGTWMGPGRRYIAEEEGSARGKATSLIT